MGNTAIPEQSELVYSICSDIPVPVFSEVLDLLPTILTIYLLVRLYKLIPVLQNIQVYAFTDYTG